MEAARPERGVGAGHEGDAGVGHARTCRAGLKRAGPSSLYTAHFRDAAAAFRPLARSTFFDRMASTYGDRVFAFDHFSVSRTPEENARMLLEGLPDGTTTFDVVTHSRGGLVLRNLAERAAHLGTRARRFKLGRAVLVASPNEGTPLATPKRWEDTVGWVANLLEMLPDNPFTTGASFVANGIVWLANHASGDLPGLHSMDADGELIAVDTDAPWAGARRIFCARGELPSDRRYAEAARRYGHRSILPDSERSCRPLRGRMAHRPICCRTHTRVARRVLRPRRQPAGGFGDAWRRSFRSLRPLTSS